MSDTKKPGVVGRGLADSTLEDELERAKRALRVAEAAHICLQSGDDEALLALGFSSDHIADLRGSPRGPCAGYPPYTLRNLRTQVRWLRASLAGNRAT